MKTTYKKKCVAVGKDIIEDAEFFKNEYDYSKNKKTLKDRLWYFRHNITMPFRRVKHKVKDAYWEVRYGFQRMFLGYDSVDIFDTYDKFIERYYKILTRYKNNHMGYPAHMSEKEWEDIIDEMLYHLYYMKEKNVDEKLRMSVGDGWIPTLETTDKIMEKHKDEFFVLFSKYFYNLWD